MAHAHFDALLRWFGDRRRHAAASLTEADTGQVDLSRRRFGQTLVAAVVGMGAGLLHRGDLLAANKKHKSNHKHKKGKSKHKKKKKQVAEYWNGYWSLYRGLSQTYGGTVSLTQTGVNISGELADQEGHHLPIVATATGTDYKNLVGTMSNEFTSNIALNLFLRADNSFTGTEYLAGPFGGTFTWEGVKIL